MGVLIWGLSSLSVQLLEALMNFNWGQLGSCRCRSSYVSVVLFRVYVTHSHEDAIADVVWHRGNFYNP
jgi:hypothetical protein